MPNWCENHLRVSGTAEAMDAWRLALQNDKSIQPLLSFQKLLPLPSDKEEDWYQWCVENWGTKWDVADGEEGITPFSSYPEEYQYSFDTAWGPPIDLVINIKENFPGVNFELAYVETGQCFAGHFKIVENKVSHDEYDSPEDVNWFAEDFFGFTPYQDLEDFEEDM